MTFALPRPDCNPADPRFGLGPPRPGTRTAGLLRRVARWAVFHAGGGGEPPAELAGATWDQRTWYAELDDGTVTCCAAGATARLAGASFAEPSRYQHEGLPAGTYYKACDLGGEIRYVPEAAARFLGLDFNEASLVFSPHRTALELLAAAGLLDAGTRVTPAALHAAARLADLQDLTQARPAGAAPGVPGRSGPPLAGGPVGGLRLRGAA